MFLELMRSKINVWQPRGPPPQATKHGQDVMIQKWTDDNIQFRKRHQALQTEPTHSAPRMTPASVN